MEFELLESLLLDNGKYFLREEHLNRMGKSARYFGFDYDVNNVNKTLNEFSCKNNNGVVKVRILLSKSGEMVIEGQPVTPLVLLLR